MKKPQEQDYWDQVSTTFNDAGEYRLWRCHSDNVNRDLLQRWFPQRPVRRVLKTDLFDEAISDGLYPWLARKADQVSGVDLAEKTVAAARARYPALDAHAGDLRALPFDDASFDCIVSNSSLDHFPSLTQLHGALAELFRVLSPGGRLIVTLDNVQNPLLWLRSVLPQTLLARTGLVPYYVGKSLGRRKLVSSLSAAGFTVRATRGILHCPRVLSVRQSGRMQQRDADEQQAFLRKLARWEKLADWPSAYFSAHFVAAQAEKPA